MSAVVHRAASIIAVLRRSERMERIYWTDLAGDLTLSVTSDLLAEIEHPECWAAAYDLAGREAPTAPASAPPAPVSKWEHRRWPGGCWIDRLAGQLRAGVMNPDRMNGGVIVVWIDLCATRRFTWINRRRMP